MKIYYRKIVYYTFAILFGVFMVVYGGYDDSPGAQFIGLIMFGVGVIGLIRNKNTN